MVFESLHGRHQQLLVRLKNFLPPLNFVWQCLGIPLYSKFLTLLAFRFAEVFKDAR
jgi:hypothetical protein